MNLQIKKLKEQLKEGNQIALDSFKELLKDKGTPLLQEIDGDSKHLEATFIYESEEPLENVLFFGGIIDFGNFNPKDYVMKNIEGTNFWYITLNLRNDIKFSYYFFPNDSLEKICKDRWGKRKWDKYNEIKRVSEGETGDSAITSNCFMPLSDEDTWLTPRTDGKCGKLDEYEFESANFKEPRKIQVYTPHGYDPEKEYSYILFSDGSEYTGILSAGHALDNLIAKGEIEPSIGIFINSEDERFQELSCNDIFCDTAINEIIPWVKERYSLSSDPSKNVTCGLSLGGLTAAYMGLKYPHVFGKVLAQSASFWFNPEVEVSVLNSEEYLKTKPESWMSIQFKNVEKLPLKFYLNVGELEGENMTRNICCVRDTLKDLGYEVHYETFKSGHDYLSWGQTFATGMIALSKSN